MINQEKLKTMVQLALYDKKQFKKDFRVCSFHKKDYVRFEGLKTAVLVTLAYVVMMGLFVLWHLEWLIENFDMLNVGRILAAAIAVYVLLMLFYVISSCRNKAEEYNQAHPGIRRYQRGIMKMKVFYSEEDRVQRQFEKGEWRNGQ